MRKIEISGEKARIVSFIQEQVNSAGMETLIVGISGGIDSAVTLGLCVEALGANQVKGFLLPYRKSLTSSSEHGRLAAEAFGVEYEVIDISPMVDAYFCEYEPDADDMRRGNRMARERMCVLYDQSAKYKGLVAGTGNKSELLTGYMTQYGDGACAFEPLGHLYKTEVYQLAELLRVPREIITKKPTADLWKDQTDEDELGMSYNTLDEILYLLYEKGYEQDQVQRAGFETKDIKRVKQLVKRSEFKRKLPPQLKENF